MEILLSVAIMYAKKFWMPNVGEVLQYEKEEGNSHDLYVVVVNKLDSIVSHVPCSKQSFIEGLYSDFALIFKTLTHGRKQFLEINFYTRFQKFPKINPFENFPLYGMHNHCQFFISQ